ncbi:hypothetical protein PLUTE_a6007 [Pseudoalteromonas luteoviolacea DSM 6061]|nr:hypothetical protein [Pseudoalteromonas luteoviolacea DSM 6061]
MAVHIVSTKKVSMGQAFPILNRKTGVFFLNEPHLFD